MTYGQVLERIQIRFFKALEAKTGWGKEEVKKIYREIEAQTLREYLDGKGV